MEYKLYELNDPYSLERIVYEFSGDTDLYNEFIDNLIKNKDYDILEFYIEKYVEYLNELIDEANNFEVYTSNSEIENMVNKKFNFDYKKHKFNICSIEEKNRLKELIKFNVNYDTWDFFIIPVENNHIANDSDLEFNDVYYYFYKDDDKLFDFHCSNGLIYDHRNSKEIYEHIDKYHKITKK